MPLKQKRYHHTPQGKVLEFLVAILAGLKHLQEISLSAHPLDRDPAVAQAWGQPGWADYSGVSRTLTGPIPTHSTPGLRARQASPQAGPAGSASANCSAARTFAVRILGN